MSGKYNGPRGELRKLYGQPIRAVLLELHAKEVLNRLW
jgi:hypothetical protein